MRKILVIGPRGHGKTTFCGFLSDMLLNCLHIPTSRFIMHRVAERNGVQLPCHTDKSYEETKDMLRTKLIEMGNTLCDLDPGILVSICTYAGLINKADTVIVDGVRRKIELDAVRKIFDHIIYLDRPGHEEGFDNFELFPDDADIYIANDGDEPSLYSKAIAFREKIS